MYAIGIDLGGTNIKIGLVRNGEIVNTSSIESLSGKGLKSRLTNIEETIADILNKTSVNISEVSGIGMSVPGIVDNKHKKILVINDKFNDVVNLDLAQWAKSKLGLPLAIDNDARCALIGEWQFGAGKGFENLVMITLGTGIGTSALVNGRVMRGSHYVAGILGGHFIVNREGLQCNCGNRGCAEAQASTWNLPEIVKYTGTEELYKSGIPVDFKYIFAEAARGNYNAIKVRNHCMDIWTEVIVNMVYAYDPERIVLAGGVMKSADVIIPYIKDNIRNYGWAPFDDIEIVCSSVPADIAILSSEYLVKTLT